MRRSRKKSVTDVPGVHAMRTLHSTGRRSIPKGHQSSAFIDLYMLSKERDRLEKEALIIGRRNKIIERRLKDIEKENERLRAQEIENLLEGGRAIRKSIPARTLKSHTPKNWNRVALHY